MARWFFCKEFEVPKVKDIWDQLYNVMEVVVVR